MPSIDFQKTKADFHSQFSINIKKALVITLVFFILLVFISPRIKLSVKEVGQSNIIINVENIPITRQTRMKPPPPKPTVPIPSEDETIPEDATIEEDFGWVFFYQSKRYMTSRKFVDRLAGNSPVIISESEMERLR